MSEKEEAKIPARMIPVIDPDAQVVRCVCPLRLPSGPMIKCTRCGCLSHKKCVTVTDPFICEFCHQAAQRVLEESYGTMVTPTGGTIQLFALRDALLNEFTALEVLEIKEHCAAGGQIGNLLDHIALYFLHLQTDLDHIEQFCLNAVPEELQERIKNEAEAKRELYKKISALAIQLKQHWNETKQKSTVLGFFRDAVLQSMQ